jgi:hypothetical protein
MAQSPASAPRSNAPKLRESCDPCAASKVKCDKKKPTYMRCARRGVTCEYLVTKRVGRQHTARPNVAAGPTSTTQNQRSSISATVNLRTDTFKSPPGLIQPSPKLGSFTATCNMDASGTPHIHHPPSPNKHPTPTPGDHPDPVPHILSPADSASWRTTPMSSNNDINDFLASLMSFPGLEPFVPDIMAKNSNNFDFDSDGFDSGFLIDVNNAPSFSTQEDASMLMDTTLCGLPGLSKPSSTAEAPTSSLLDSQTSFDGFTGGAASGGAASDAPHCCLVNALSLLSNLSPNPSTACQRSGTRPCNENMSIQIPNIQSIIVKNEQTIDAIRNMLQCRCSQDSYLLVIVSLVTFKVLSWYATAAGRDSPTSDGSQSPGASQSDQGQPSCHPDHVLQFPSASGSDCGVEGEDQGRMANLLVLSKLHRAQQLANMLSTRLKHAEGQEMLCDADPNPSPFSATMLNQLEADLRNRLRGLSLDIVDRLRRA